MIGDRHVGLGEFGGATARDSDRRQQGDRRAVSPVRQHTRGVPLSAGGTANGTVGASSEDGYTISAFGIGNTAQNTDR